MLKDLKQDLIIILDNRSGFLDKLLEVLLFLDAGQEN